MKNKDLIINKAQGIKMIFRTVLNKEKIFKY